MPAERLVGFVQLWLKLQARLPWLFRKPPVPPLLLPAWLRCSKRSKGWPRTQKPSSCCTASTLALDDLGLLTELVIEAWRHEPHRASRVALLRLRGEQALAQLLQDSGGTLRPAEVQQLLGLSGEGVRKRRDRKRLLGWRHGKHTIYPAFQFDQEQARVWPALEMVLPLLDIRSWATRRLRCSAATNRLPLRRLRARHANSASTWPAEVSLPLPPQRYPPSLRLRSIPAGSQWLRIHRCQRASGLYWGRNEPGRWNDPEGSFGVLYAADGLETAFAETFGHEVMVEYAPAAVKFLTVRELQERCVARLTACRDLHVVDLSGPHHPRYLGVPEVVALVAWRTAL